MRERSTSTDHAASPVPADALMRDASTPPQSPTIFAPFRNRHRMLTEDAIWMHNSSTTQPTLDDAATTTTMDIPSSNTNPFLERDDISSGDSTRDHQDSDDHSDVSSLSHDSRRRYSPAWDNNEETEVPKGPPPLEISIRSNGTVPDWLMDDLDNNDEPLPPPPALSPVWTGAASPSPSIPRPTMGRHRTSPMLFSSTRTMLIRPKMLRVSTTTTSTETTTTTAGGGDQSIFSSDTSVLGTRPRRTHRKSPSSCISIGSIVGMSSFVTAPTVTPTAASSSSLVSDHSSWQAQRALENLHGRVKKKSPVKQDLKYAWGRVVSTPIRRLTGTAKKVALQRSKSGCLT